jgi:hypothetical protein
MEFPITPGPDDSDGGITYSVGIELSRFTGSTLIIGDTVFLSDEGVEVLASTDGNYYAVNAYSFRDADNEEIGGMYARDDAGQNIVGFRVVDQAGNDDDTILEIVSHCEDTVGVTASVIIGTKRGTSSMDTVIQIEDDGTGEIDILTPTGGRVRIGEKLNLLGASGALCDVYMKSSYFILKYNDGGTTRYKYLNLSGTGTTWTHSPSEP